jgi:hypothetical protein
MGHQSMKENKLMSRSEEATKSVKIRQLSIEQLNAIDHLLQGRSDRATAEAVGVSRQTIWEWRNKNPVFIAELNKGRRELWTEARERMKTLANIALDAMERELNGSDPKAAIASAKYILQGTKLLDGSHHTAHGPITPEGVILEELRKEAYEELKTKADPRCMLNPLKLQEESETLARSRLKKALEDAGLAQ